ncbi:DUF6385 domain-containing protein [Anaerosolibacter sp.]|uniref:DUF6385 domain-containing protein n=1 Tax=Anaerosolibacter sp. TaxID=1872527 RepID=UPI0039F054DE
MPNNLVFNNVARDLKTQIYGNDNGAVTAISVSADGKLQIGEISTITYVGTLDTVNYVASVDTVTEVANVSSVDTVDYVASVDTVTEITNVSSVDTIDYLASVGTVTHITDTVDVKIVSNDFAEDVATVQPLAAGAVATVLTTNTSEMNMYSLYVRNTSDTVTIDAQVQIAPIDEDAYYINDVASVTGLTADSIEVLVPQKYLKYTRLILSNNSTAAGSVVAYFQGHN